ncbi:MAG: hypothetical protein KUG81_11090 [Gammaproteobacteria bacterium]|nr:hypothetical protein [Gammaproteobacteria bacterium]
MFKEYAKFMAYTVLTIAILGTVSAIGYQLSVVGERLAFQNSFQYDEGMNQRARTLKAQIDQVDILLMGNPENYQELQAQKRILTVQLNATNN